MTESFGDHWKYNRISEPNKINKENACYTTPNCLVPSFVLLHGKKEAGV